MDENYRLFFNIKLPEIVVEEEEVVEKRKTRGDEEGEEYEEEEFEEEFEEEEPPAEPTETEELTAEEEMTKEESKAKLLEIVTSSKVLVDDVSAGALGLQPSSIGAIPPEISGGALVSPTETLIEEHAEEPEQEQTLTDMEKFLESLRASGLKEGVSEEGEGDEEKGILLYPKDEVCGCNFLIIIINSAKNKVDKSIHSADLLFNNNTYQ